MVTVDCKYFRFDIRAKDTSGNYSPPISREFRAPFSGSGNTPGVTPTLVPIPFVANSKLSNAPAVVVKNRTATLRLQEITLPIKEARVLRRMLAKVRAARNKESITYRLDCKNNTTRELKRLTSKKNVIALKNLSPGNYSANYKAELRTDNKVTATTKKSPAVKFSISR